MLNSETLEVAIGMVFLFLLMSLICTAIKEWIEAVLKWRAMDLERAIRNLLNDDSGQTSAALYKHPGIYALFQGTYQVEKLARSWFTMGTGAGRHMPLTARRNLPSYIPTAHFATAFIDHIARGESIRPEAAPPSSHWQALCATALRVGHALAFWRTVKRPVVLPPPEQPRPHEPLTVELLRARAALQPEYLRQLMYSVLDYAEGDIAKVRKQVERWFDGAMDRASGWYKRRTQALLFLIGLAAAVVLNVDALHILHRLTTDKSLREAVAHRAEAAKAPTSAESQAATTATADLRALKQTRAELEAVALPIGWEHDEENKRYSIWPTQFCAASEITGDAVTRHCKLPDTSPVYPWTRIALGWLITALAIMLGAPFWFDVLNRIMVIRSTVKPHEKSPEEPSQDGGSDKVHRLVVSAAPTPKDGQ